MREPARLINPQHYAGNSSSTPACFMFTEHNSFIRYFGMNCARMFFGRPEESPLPLCALRSRTCNETNCIYIASSIVKLLLVGSFKSRINNIIRCQNQRKTKVVLGCGLMLYAQVKQNGFSYFASWELFFGFCSFYCVLELLQILTVHFASAVI